MEAEYDELEMMFVHVGDLSNTELREIEAEGEAEDMDLALNRFESEGGGWSD